VPGLQRAQLQDLDHYAHARTARRPRRARGRRACDADGIEPGRDAGHLGRCALAGASDACRAAGACSDVCEAEWRRRGSLPFFHYADNAERELDYAFYEDSLGYDAFNAVVPQPTLVFQGLRDASVDYRTVEQFANTRSNVTLSLLDDDHQLIASLPRMWNDIQPFLGIGE
jgi:hypothetical protein